MPPDWSLLTKEALRKSLHMAGFVIPLVYYFFIPRTVLLFILAAAVAAAALLELIRTSGNPIFPRVLLREHEEKGVLAGYFYSVLSMFLALLLFDKTVATAAMLFLTLGDGITGLAGALMSELTGRKEADKRDYSHTARPLLGELSYAASHHKPPVLMAVMLVTCGFIGLALYPALSPAAIIAGALGSVIADAFPWSFFGIMVDDNLSIPLLSGALMILAGAL
jgi:dolichol kinase